MASRLVHLSDLHFRARNLAQVEALIRGIDEARPDLVVITGDLTRSGRARQFRAAADFMERLPQRQMILPGNHDVPLFNVFLRFGSPFRRFAKHFPRANPPVEETPDIFLVGLNTAASFHAALDWSLGRASPARIADARQVLARTPAKLRLVAAHHPLLPDEIDERRSRTANGTPAFQALAEAGMDIFLHGHMHRTIAVGRPFAGRTVWSIGATTALSERERGDGSGFNVLEVDEGEIRLIQMVWQTDRYAQGKTRALSRAPQKVS